jgi:hypothetical protein
VEKMTTKLQLLAAIKAHCLECAGSWKDLNECPGSKVCRIHPYRTGQDPEEASEAMKAKGRHLSEAKKSKLLHENLYPESHESYFTSEYIPEYK